MDLNTILLWLVIVSCAVFLARVAKYRAFSRTKSWTLVVFVVFIATLIFAAAAPDYAGFGGAALWCVVMVIPNAAIRGIFVLNLRGKFKLARMLAYVVRALHPFGESWRLPDLCGAYALAQSGKFDESRAILAQYFPPTTLQGVLQHVFLLRAEQRWEEIAEIGAQVPLATLQLDPSLNTFIRALGECGDYEAMVHLAYRVQGQLRKSGMFSLTFMVMAALLGRRDLVERALASQTVLPDAQRRFWRASATLAAGAYHEAASVFHELLQTQDVALRLASARRLARRLTPTVQLSPVAGARFNELVSVFDQLERFGAARHIHTPLVTYALIALCVVMYAIELFCGDPTSAAVLYELGGMVPAAVLMDGEWWRILSAQFLHAGALHLLFNMLCLYDLAPFVERTLGWLKYASLYLLCGSVAIVAVVGSAYLGMSSPGSVVVGASGGIMAILGMNLALLFRAWRRERVSIAHERFHVLLRIVALQVVIDFFTPQISSTAHLVGLAMGFVTALCVGGREESGASVLRSWSGRA